MERVFAVILETSAYGALVGLAILLSKKLLKNRLNGKWHFLLWALLLVKLVFPFGPESAFSLFNIVPAVPTQVLMGGPLEQTPGTGIVEISPPQLEQPIATPSRTAYGSVFAYTWGGGVVLFTFWLLGSFLVFNNKIHRDSLVVDARVMKVFEGAKKTMSVNRSINILLSNNVETPSLFGLWRPQILLPAAACQLTDKELEYILLHELAHYRRKDVLVNYLLLAIHTVHWFNPVIWYLFKCVRQDMELATDEMVLHTLESAEHKSYGRALLTVLASFSEPRLSAKLLYMADNRENIERRINMIKMAELFKRKRKAVFAAGMLCIAVLAGALLTNGLSRGSAAIEPDITPDLIKCYPFNEQEGWLGQSVPLFELSAPSDISIVTGAIRDSIKIQGILNVASPHYEIMLQSQKAVVEIVYLWLPLNDADTGVGMIMYPPDTHTGYTLTKKDTAALINLFAKKSLARGHEFGTEQLTMSAVRALASGEITPAGIIARYKGRSVTSGIHSFYTEIPDDYALMIGFGGLDPLEVFYIRLIDTRIDVYIGLTGVPLALFDRFSTRQTSLNSPNSIDLSPLFYDLIPYPVDEWSHLETARNVGTVLNRQNVYRLVRAEGATVNGYTYFTYTDGKPQILVRFYAADAWEEDVNGDGSREIVYTSGSPGSNIRIVTAAGSKLREVNLNAVLSSPSIEYSPSNNEFAVSYAFDNTTYTYRFEPRTWTLRR